MPRVLKVIVATVVFLMGLASMGMVSLKDSLERPEYCATCHQDPYYASWKGSDYLAATHARAAVPCQTCHRRSLGESVEEIVTELRGGYRLRKIKVSKERCLQCHSHPSYSEVIERTARGKLNPHEPHHYGEMDCAICHKMHRPSEDYCSYCHEPTASGEGWITKERKTRPL
jgi:Cytochrome c3